MTDIDIADVLRRTYEEIFPADDEAALRDVVGQDCISHDGGRDSHGLAAISGTMHWLAGTFADRRWDIRALSSDGDIATMFCTFHGRHVGDLPGLPATLRSVAVPQVHVVRFEGGKGVEHWGFENSAVMQQQLAGSVTTAA